MPSFLSKFVRGVATEGAELYADKARVQLRDKLMAERDAVLQENRMSVQKQQQAYQSGEADKINLRREEAATTATTAQTEAAELKATAKVTEAETKFGYDKELAGMRGTSGAKTPADVLKVKALVASGRVETEADAWDLVLNNVAIPAKDIFKVLADSQVDGFTGEKLKEGDKGYMTTEDMTKEAKRIASGKEKKPDAGIPKPTTQADFDALKSGDIYIDPDDGKKYRKP